MRLHTSLTQPGTGGLEALNQLSGPLPYEEGDDAFFPLLHSFGTGRKGKVRFPLFSPEQLQSRERAALTLLPLWSILYRDLNISGTIFSIYYFRTYCFHLLDFW